LDSGEGVITMVGMLRSLLVGCPVLDNEHSFSGSDRSKGYDIVNYSIQINGRDRESAHYSALDSKHGPKMFANCNGTSSNALFILTFILIQ
jgi:hypothetical protein